MPKKFYEIYPWAKFFRSGHVFAMHLHCYTVKLPSLKLKTWPKQLLSSLLFDIAILTEESVTI